jgi:hypothetical protein
MITRAKIPNFKISQTNRKTTITQIKISTIRTALIKTTIKIASKTKIVHTNTIIHNKTTISRISNFLIMLAIKIIFWTKITLSFLIMTNFLLMIFKTRISPKLLPMKRKMNQ